MHEVPAFCYATCIATQSAAHSFLAEEAFLIFANRDDSTEGITMTNLDGTNSKRLVTSMTASGLDYDFR